MLSGMLPRRQRHSIATRRPSADVRVAIKSRVIVIGPCASALSTDITISGETVAPCLSAEAPRIAPSRGRRPVHRGSCAE